MKRLLLLIPFALMASPALAHSGAHLHPHGYEVFVALGALAAVAAALYFKTRL